VAADAERQIMTAAREQVAEDVRRSSPKPDFAA
jgi:hypothetical protein